MQCYTELVPPSGVTHSLRLDFTAPDANNLIVVRTSVLQIFAAKQLNRGQDTRLILVAEFALSGTVTAIEKVKLQQSKSGGDAILVSCRDAKLSLAEWDPAHYSISTISIHYYENHDLLLCPWTPDLRDCVSHLTADPSSRCAAFNFGVNNLAIIPFHQRGDDLAMDDFDDMDDVDDEKQANATTVKDGDTDHKTPYAPSFVLPLTVLDPGLLHPVDMAFLHEYREPTIGILYSTAAPSINMAFERRDVMIYAVYTLDIEQRASISLLSIRNLPNDLYKVVSLPLPVGGVLLIGGNEIMHVDQGGKVTAVAVNEFTKACSSFPMTDQSDLEMRLEGCQIDNIGASTADMLIVLSTGELVGLSFRLDGRSVSGLSLRRLDYEQPGRPLLQRASNMTHIGHGRIFVGSEESDSVLLGTGRKASLLKRHSTRGQNGVDGVAREDEKSEGSDDEEDDDDDLYADPNGTNGAVDQGITGSGVRVLDRLPSLGPINDFAFGRPPKRKRPGPRSTRTGPKRELEPDLELALSCGRGKSGALAFLQREITPKIIKRTRHQNAVGLWSIVTKREGRDGTENVYDDTVILSSSSRTSPSRSTLMTLQEGQFEPGEGRDFDINTTTVAVGRLAAANRTVQVSNNDIRVYDEDFGLAQILPIVDEDSGETAQVASANIVEPYVLFVKDDQTISLLKADKNGDLDDIELPANVPSRDIVSASIYRDSTNFFSTNKYGGPQNSNSLVILSVLAKDGGFSLFPLTDLKVQVFKYHGLHFLPPLLSPSAPIPKHWKNPDEISEILLSDLGDISHQSPYLVVRNTTGDIVLYEAFSVPEVEGSYGFHKIATRNADASDEPDIEAAKSTNSPFVQHLVSMPNLDGYRTIFITGQTPSVILKSSSSIPRIHRFRAKGVKHVSGLNDPTCPNGFVYIDSKSRVTVAQLPEDTLFMLSDSPIRKVPLGGEVTFITHHNPTSTYLLATTVPTPFQLPQDDEWHPEWTFETTGFLPTTYTSILKLVSSSDPYHDLSTFVLDPNEQVLNLQSLSLEISEETHERQDMIVVGTAIIKGENVVTRGNIYIFSVAKVNPDPEIHPADQEYDLKLKLVTKEDVRGSVSAITGIGSQGFLLASQGQKAMVRGLKEDKTLLPVAFLDMRFHVSVARELAGTGLTILGDAFSGLWLMGYGEEPYKMQLLARDMENPEVVTADFLPDNKQLFIISCNGDGEIRVLEYDPENPKTERGSKLLMRSTFDTGAYQNKIGLVPRTPTSSEALAIAAAFGPTSSSSSRRKNRGLKKKSRKVSREQRDSESYSPEPGGSGSPLEQSIEQGDDDNDLEEGYEEEEEGEEDGEETDDNDNITVTDNESDNAMDIDFVLNNSGIDNNNNNNNNNFQSSSTSTNQNHQLLLTSQTGSISLLTPLTEPTYRRLSTLQNILTTQLEHPLGLNPRAYRNVETDGIGGRGVIDGNIIRRWIGLGTWHKGVMCGKVGGSVWDVRGDLELVCGGGCANGLGYL